VLGGPVDDRADKDGSAAVETEDKFQ